MKKCRCGNDIKVVENIVDDTYLIKLYCNNCGNMSPVLYTKVENKEKFKESILRRWNDEQSL